MEERSVNENATSINEESQESRSETGSRKGSMISQPASDASMKAEHKFKSDHDLDSNGESVRLRSGGHYSKTSTRKGERSHDVFDFD